MEMRTLLEIGLKAIYVTLWQRTSLHFVHTPRLRVSLDLSGRGKFKVAPQITVAWLLLLARFGERIGIKGQSREIGKLVI